MVANGFLVVAKWLLTVLSQKSSPQSFHAIMVTNYDSRRLFSVNLWNFLQPFAAQEVCSKI